MFLPIIEVIFIAQGNDRNAHIKHGVQQTLRSIMSLYTHIFNAIHCKPVQIFISQSTPIMIESMMLQYVCTQQN